MFKITRKSIEWGGRTLTLETGRIARQADGAVLATYGGTSVLCTITAAKAPKPDIDFFPLTVNYQEKFYAAGKIPGGFFRREGKPTEKETLTSRLIDRPIRPMFHKNFRNDTQIVCTVISHDLENDPDIVAMVGTSAALAISGVPFEGPIGAARVGYENGEYVLNPLQKVMTEAERADDAPTLDLIVAGTRSSVLMVESEAKELSEEVMLGAVVFGHEEFQPVLDVIEEFAKEAGKPAWEVQKPAVEGLEQKVAELGRKGLAEAYTELQKQKRVEKVNAVREQIKKGLPEILESHPTLLSSAIKELEMEVVRGKTLETKKRIDGRDEKSIRPILAEVGVFPRTHGSALFTRGETQALVIATLGSGQDEQLIDALESKWNEHFMLHYNFPPYSVGEALPLRPPGRREIGHGKLAWRAIHPLLPSKADFPYTLRVVSEITESNGSSSMATVCGSSLALMDAGVPLPRPVAGIAMGLIKEGDKFIVLSDILGDEDHLGDMDFKVAGTEKGVTALQMDIKINGITKQIMDIALNQAKDGRLHILKEMSKAMTEAREGVSEFAPKITTMQIDKEKIREVIGSGGSVIRDICEKSGAKIDIEDDGTIRIAAVNGQSAKIAEDMIKSIVMVPEIGQIYTGKVVNIVDFGAFVRMGAKDGLVHISELADHRVNKVTDVVNEGDEVKVKVLEIDNRGKIRLSLRAVNQETGEDISDQLKSRGKKAAEA